VEESSYLSLPGKWSDVPAVEITALRELARAIDGLGEQGGHYSPEDLATQLASSSERILDSIAGEERDLREMIRNLRVCLAVSWDMYDKIGADSTTVTQHIENLRDQIQGLEAELTALKLEGTRPPRE
jgi:hypothetical protein